jgi:hypothetical protein
MALPMFVHLGVGILNDYKRDEAVAPDVEHYQNLPHDKGRCKTVATGCCLHKELGLSGEVGRCCRARHAAATTFCLFLQNRICRKQVVAAAGSCLALVCIFLGLPCGRLPAGMLPAQLPRLLWASIAALCRDPLDLRH